MQTAIINNVYQSLPNYTIQGIRNRWCLYCDTDKSTQTGKVNMNIRLSESDKILNLRKMIDYFARRDQLATNSSFHHHRQCQTYFHAEKIDISLLWQMCPVNGACRQLVDVPIPTFVRIRLDYRLGTVVTVDERTYAWCCRLCVSVPLRMLKGLLLSNGLYAREFFYFTTN